MIGLSPARAVEQLGQLLDRLPTQLRGLAQPVIAVLLDLIGTDPSTQVAVAGVPNLTRFSDQFDTTIRPVLEALEEQVVLLRLLGEVGSTTEVKVRIGHENSVEGLGATSVITSRYGRADLPVASLGVVGPTHMDNPGTIAAVHAVARYVSQILDETA